MVLLKGGEDTGNRLASKGTHVSHQPPLHRQDGVCSSTLLASPPAPMPFPPPGLPSQPPALSQLLRFSSSSRVGSPGACPRQVSRNLGRKGLSGGGGLEPQGLGLGQGGGWTRPQANRPEARCPGAMAPHPEGVAHLVGTVCPWQTEPGQAAHTGSLARRCSQPCSPAATRC